MMRKCAVTNIEIIQGLGQDGQKFWQALQQPERAKPKLIEQIDDLNLLSEDRVRRMDRTSQLLATCTKKMIKQLDPKDIEPAESIGMCTSTNFSTFNTIISFITRVYRSGPGRANPMEFPSTAFNACTGYACMETGLKGYNNTLAGFGSLGEAFDAIQLNRAKAMVVAGVDQAGDIQQTIYNHHYGHDLELSEGAATLLLTNKNKVNPIAWYLGYATTFDAQGLDKIDQEGTQLGHAIINILEKNQLTINEIDGLVCSSGTIALKSKKIGQPLQQIFQEKLNVLPFYHLESSCGYTAGTAEVLAATLASQMLKTSTWLGQGSQPQAAPFDGKTILMIITDQFGCNYCHLLQKA